MVLIDSSVRISLQEAARRLKRGEVVAVPTETVYGLAALLPNAAAVQKIFTLKGRPQDNPLIVHIGEPSELQALVKNVPAEFSKVAGFWPGPLTVVLEANTARVPEAVRAGLATVGVRMPALELTRDLIALTGPLVAPSANVSGRPSATTPEHVEADFGADFPVLDGGYCARGVESTIISLRDGGWTCLRAGAIALEDLASAMGSESEKHAQTKRPLSPGQKYRHYAPRCALKLCFARDELDALQNGGSFDAVLGFDETLTKSALYSLGPKGDFAENLRRLYATLRDLDAKSRQNVLVDMDFQVAGLGATLRDRLEKAAKKK